MAKISQIVKNQRRLELAEKHRARRQELLKIIKSPEATQEQRDDAYRRLRKMPRDASATRYKNRCVLTGRGHAYYRRFGLSRIMLRELALKGEIPGLKKASW